MAIQAQQRITFHKIVDGTTVSFSLTTNQGVTQVKSKDPVSYFPNYPTQNLIITPVLSVSGATGNQVNKTCTWYIDGVRINSGQNGFTIETTGNFALKLAQNLTKASTIIRCEFDYVQPVTNLVTTVTAQIALNQVENAGTMIMAQILPRSGTIFQTQGGAVQDLIFDASMIRGGDEDTTNVQYSWEITGTNGQYYAITGATAPAGSGLPAGTLFAGAGTKTLTVKSNAIINIGTIRLTCKDTDTTSSTYNKLCRAVVSVADMTDPYDMVLSAPKGTAMSAGNSTGLPMEIILQQGGTILSEAFYDRKRLVFYRLTEAGDKDVTWAPAGSDFTGWQIASGEVSRTYDSTNRGTSANRTVYIKPTHLLASATTTFNVAIEF